jgi:hypothetical protein
VQEKAVEVHKKQVERLSHDDVYYISCLSLMINMSRTSHASIHWTTTITKL